MYYSYINFCPLNWYRIIYPPPLDNKNPISVGIVPIEYEDSSVKENLRIPVLHGAVNQRILGNINASLKNDIMEFKSEMERAAADMKKEGKEVRPFLISNNYSITYNKNHIISITIIYNENINGRNTYIKTSYNFDIISGKSLAIKDLFKEGTDYKRLINKKITEKLELSQGMYFPGILAKFKGIAEDQPFYLEGNNLVLFFGFNEIAPLASEIPVLKIPIQELKEAIKPELLRNI